MATNVPPTATPGPSAGYQDAHRLGRLMIYRELTAGSTSRRQIANNHSVQNLPMPLGAHTPESLATAWDLVNVLYDSALTLAKLPVENLINIGTIYPVFSEASIATMIRAHRSTDGSADQVDPLVQPLMEQINIQQVEQALVQAITACALVANYDPVELVLTPVGRTQAYTRLEDVNRASIIINQLLFNDFSFPSPVGSLILHRLVHSERTEPSRYHITNSLDMFGKPFLIAVLIPVFSMIIWAPQLYGITLRPSLCPDPFPGMTQRTRTMLHQEAEGLLDTGFLTGSERTAWVRLVAQLSRPTN